MPHPLLISELKKNLDEYSWGEGIVWPELETETIILELYLQDSLINRDRINVTRILTVHPELFFEDFLFFAHAISVMNSNATDFGTLILPTSLEVALGIVDISVIRKELPEELPRFSEGVQELVKFILMNEGYSKVLYPFDIIGTKGLSEGQTEQDTKDKVTAINQYVTASYG